jgi:hypothetical protein
VTVSALLAVVLLASKRSRHEATSMSAGSRLLLSIFAADALELFNPSSAKFLLDFLRLLGLSCREDLLRIA